MTVTPVLGRLLRSADFERVLGAAACARSAHFAVHFVAGRPGPWSPPAAGLHSRCETVTDKLSTTHEQCSAHAVDDSPFNALVNPVATIPDVWLGVVVPKRHAKRAVTRTLLKRQIGAALLRRELAGRPALRQGLWVVRLRAPFDRAAFPSAASSALRRAASSELDCVLMQAGRKLAHAAPASGATA